MELSKDYEEQDKIFRKKLEKESKFIVKFAFIPVKLNNGVWIWLERYLFKHDHYQDKFGDWHRSMFVTRKKFK